MNLYRLKVGAAPGDRSAVAGIILPAIIIIFEDLSSGIFAASRDRAVGARAA